MAFLRKICFISNKNDNAVLAANVCYQKKKRNNVNEFFFDKAHEQFQQIH